MTREEAIEVLENGTWWDLIIPVTTIDGRIEEDKLHKALDIALAALRPITQEDVEKVWRGCEHCTNSHARQNLGYQFCEHCGRPLTDEAMQMVMERLEELNENRD